MKLSFYNTFQIAEQRALRKNLTKHVRLDASNERHLYSDGGDNTIGWHGSLYNLRHFVTLLPVDVTYVDVHRSRQHVPSSHQSLHYLLLLLYPEKMHCCLGYA